MEKKKRIKDWGSKARRTKSFVWENKNQIPLRLHILPRTQSKYGSFPYVEAFHIPKYHLPWMQKSGLPLAPKTLPCIPNGHRGVQRENSGESSSFDIVKKNIAKKNCADFSNDSLKKTLLPLTKRENVPWVLGFEDEAFLTPGSTKVIGRRRKKSVEHSSANTIKHLREIEVWFEPFQTKEEKNMSPYNGVEELMLPEALPLDLTFNGTYVIKKERKKEKSYLNKNLSLEKQPKISQAFDSNSIRTTFDNIKTLLKERNIEGKEENLTRFSPPNSHTLVKVASLPSLSIEKTKYKDKVDSSFKYENLCNIKESFNQDKVSGLQNPGLNLGLIHLENEENQKFDYIRVGKNEKVFEIENLKKQMKTCNEVETQTDLSDIEKQNELELIEVDPAISKTKSELEEVEKKIQEIVKIKTVIEQEEQKEFENPWLKEGVTEKSKIISISNENPSHGFHVNVEILQHSFGPLPPSPVDEHREEYPKFSEVDSAQSLTDKTDIFSEQFYRCQNPSVSDPGGNYLNKPLQSVQHRTSDPAVAISRSDVRLKMVSRKHSNELRKENTTERLTLPTEFYGPVLRHQTFHKKSLTLPQENSLAPCFLPEAPIFIRGCDIPRTPNRYAPDNIKLGSFLNKKSRENEITPNSPNFKMGISLSGEMNQAMVGGELLRLAGGPGRGWYPRHRQHRPASTEQLDRLPYYERGLPEFWDLSGCRKPLTLPSNITPKFFHRSPREALRRVTSLLIRGKGTSLKEKKKASSRFGSATEHQSQKKGFFRNFWKRSRNYPLDEQ